jgi:hypothetical protein
MAKIEVKAFSSPDEIRPFRGHGRMEVVRTGEVMVGRGIFEPGWRWSVDVKPLAGTQSCMAEHCGYVLSGTMHLKMDDGQEAEIGPGNFVVIPPGHDAWTVGNEPCVIFDFGGGAKHYAQSRSEPAEDMVTAAAMHFSEGA